MAEGTLPPDPELPPDPTPAPGTPQDALHPPYPFDAAHAPAGVAEGTPVAKRKRRRRWPYVLLAFVLLIGLLVLLAPTMAGTGPVRGVILGQVNQRLNGRVEVADWSMGWSSPVTVSGLKVFDAAGSQVLELPRLTTELNLLDAVRGRLHFGKVTVEGLNALVRRDAQGNINLAQLVPQGAESANPQAAGPGGDGASEKTTLPDVRGELHLVNCRATFEDQLQGQTFFFPSIAGTVKCPDVNKPIENALEITCRVGTAPAGKLTLAGTADVAEDNVVSVETMEVDEKLTFDGVELGSFAFALGRDGPLDKLAGMTSGSASIRFRGGEGAALEAIVNSTGFAAGGPALKGDTFATQKLSLVVPPTTLVMPSADDWKAWVVRVGSSGGGDRVALTIDQGQVAVGADAKLEALANIAENVVPGTRGRVRADVELDVGALARQMPRVMALQEGLTLSSGRFTHSTDLQLAADRATVRNLEVHLFEVRGTRGGAGTNEPVQDISLQPINLVFTGTSFGGGWAGAALRDLNLTLDSGFANARFTGRDVADLSGKATGDLKRLRDELGQVVDMGDLRLAGPFDITVASKGDVAAGANATVSATVVVNDLVVEGLKDTPAVRQKQVWLEAGGEVVRGADGAVSQLRGGKVNFRTGDPTQPTVVADVSGTATFTPAPAPAAAGATTAPAAAVASADYQVTRLAVDLPRARAEFGEHVPALKEYAFDRGTLTVAGGGKYDAGAVSYDGAVTVADLTLARTPAPSEANPRPGRVEVLRGYNLTTDAGLTYATRGDGGAAVDVTKLSLRDDREMLALAKAGDRPLRLVTTADGRMQPSGRLELRADLKQLSDVNERLAAEVAAAATPEAPSAELRSGRLAGTVDFAPAAAGELGIAGNFEGSQLTVTGPQGNALENESVKVVAQARARDDFSAITVDKLDVTGGVLTANATGTTLQLTVGQGAAARPATTAEMVQSASVKAEVPDLGKLQALLDALATPEAAEPARAAAATSRRDTGVSPVRAAREQIQSDGPDFGPSRAAGTGGTPVSRGAVPVVFAQAPREPPPDQIIGRRPPPARPAPQQPAAPQQGPRQQPVRRDPVAPADPAAEEAPALPVKLAGGSASVSLDVRRQGERVVVTPEVTGRNVVLAKGEGRHTLDAVELKTGMSYVPVAPAVVAQAPVRRADARAAVAATTEEEGPSFAEQIRDLQIPTLTLRGAGSTISLVEPVMISDVAGLGQMFSPPDPKQPAARAAPPDVKAALRAEGDVGQLSALLVALGFIGDPAGEKQPYGGRYALEQRLAAGKDGVAAKGNLNLDDFVVAGGSSFSEKAVRFANDVTLDSAKDALSLRSVTLAMESTKALELKLAGNVLDYSTKRRLENVAGTLGYDWAKLWEIVRPTLSKEQQENLKLRIAGQAQRQFALGGSYPAVADDGRALTFAESIRFLTGHFNGGFQLVEVNGLEVQNLELPLTLRDGKLVVAYHDKPEGQNYPPPADCNSGKLNIGGATVDLAEETPRLTMAKGTKLLENATLNPVFSDMFGGIINNPLFVGTKEARGLMNVTVVQCDRLPLDSLVLKQVRENDGRAEFLFSIREVYLGNSLLLEGLKLAGQSDFANSLQGEIRESRVVIERGQTKQDVTINTGEGDRPFRIFGSTALETKRLELTFTVPPQLLRQLGPTGRQAAELLADGLPIPLGGTTRAPQLDLNRALTSAVKEGLLPGLLRRATQRGQGDDEPKAETPPARDGRMDRGGDGTQPPARRDAPPTAEPKPPADPLDGIFDLIKKQREEKEREKEEERARRRQQREQRQQGGAPQGKAPAEGGASGSDRIGRQPAR